MLGAETLGLSHPLPPFLPPAAAPGRCTWSNLACRGMRGVWGPVIGGREGKSEPEEREV